MLLAVSLGRVTLNDAVFARGRLHYGRPRQRIDAAVIITVLLMYILHRVAITGFRQNSETPFISQTAPILRFALCLTIRARTRLCETDLTMLM